MHVIIRDGQLDYARGERPAALRLGQSAAYGVCGVDRCDEGQAGRHDHAQLPTRRFHALGRAQERPGLLREPYWEWAIDDLVDVRRRSSSQPSSIYYRDPQSLNNHEMTLKSLHFGTKLEPSRLQGRILEGWQTNAKKT